MESRGAAAFRKGQCGMGNFVWQHGIRQLVANIAP
jgi:hypothetical protein